ncbi:MAG: hypothetical protein ACREJC_18780 [Tepidisphaeraceae bacterium]
MDCPDCGIKLNTPAEAFLHRAVHLEPWRYGGHPNLGMLPFVLMPRVARVLDQYHEFMLKCAAGEETLEGWPCSAVFAPREKVTS